VRFELIASVFVLASCRGHGGHSKAPTSQPLALAALMETYCTSCHEESNDPAVPRFSATVLAPATARAAIVAVIDGRMPKASAMPFEHRQLLVRQLCGSAAVPDDICQWRFVPEKPVLLGTSAAVVRRLERAKPQSKDESAIRSTLSQQLLEHNKASKTSMRFDATIGSIAAALAADQCGDDEKCFAEVLQQVLQELPEKF
jgi:hypothetical protein